MRFFHSFSLQEENTAENDFFTSKSLEILSQKQGHCKMFGCLFRQSQLWFCICLLYLTPQTRFLRGSSIFPLDENVERIFNPFVLIDRNLFLYKLLLLTREKHHSLSFGFVYYNYNCLSNSCLCHISSLENTTHEEPYLSDIS